MNPSVSVIIPVFQGGDAFKRCLAGCAKLSSQPKELIVVVDGPDDESTETASRLGVRVINLPQRSGPAAARNAGADEATGDTLLFIDADVVPSPGIVKQVSDIMRTRLDLDAIIGSYDKEPGDAHFLSQYRNLLHHYVHQNSDENAHTFWGACGAIRRSVFDRIGGFDENIDIPAMEDVELGYRLCRAGHSIGLFKQLQVKHLKRWDAATMLRTDIFQRAIPWTRLLLREGAVQNDLNLRWESRFSAVLAWLLIFSIPLALTNQLWFLVAFSASMSLLLLNASLYAFFLRNRGPLFALRAIPWHWFYFLYSSASFAYVLLTEKFRRQQYN